MTLLEAVSTIILVTLMIGFFLSFVIIQESNIDIQEYLKERERQKTLRELATIQHKRETVGIAEERELFEEENFDIGDAVNKEKHSTEMSNKENKGT